jgi:hypothetical protein
VARKDNPAWAMASASAAFNGFVPIRVTSLLDR